MVRLLCSNLYYAFVRFLCSILHYASVHLLCWFVVAFCILKLMKILCVVLVCCCWMRWIHHWNVVIRLLIHHWNVVLAEMLWRWLYCGLRLLFHILKVVVLLSWFIEDCCPIELIIAWSCWFIARRWGMLNWFGSFILFNFWFHHNRVELYWVCPWILLSYFLAWLMIPIDLECVALSYSRMINLMLNFRNCEMVIWFE